MQLISSNCDALERSSLQQQSQREFFNHDAGTYPKLDRTIVSISLQRHKRTSRLTW